MTTEDFDTLADFMERFYASQLHELAIRELRGRTPMVAIDLRDLLEPRWDVRL